jgi:ornithine cyclodeaminase/alanine dehydrogenase-like protein (mu-crystallin family)
MALLITQADLEPLTRSKDGIAAAIDATEASVVASHRRGRGQVIFGDLALDDDAYVKVMGVTSPAAGMSLQVFPAQANPSFHPDQRMLLLFDPQTGSLLALLAADDLNALRTSVPAGLGARHLAPDGARVLGILGTGYQAGSHALTIAAALPQLEEIHVWSPTQAHRERFADEQAAILGLPVRACATAREVVEAADVLTAAGRIGAGQKAYEADWVKPGALLISMTRSAPAELDDVAQVVVATLQRPEIVALKFNGPSAPRPAPDPPTTIELLDVMEGRRSPRAHAGQPVVWELAQVYAWDLPIARWAYDWAVAQGVGQPFGLTDGARAAGVA